MYYVIETFFYTLQVKFFHLLLFGIFKYGTSEHIQHIPQIKVICIKKVNVTVFFRYM